ncbi:MAG TPA: GreA/GreB family elongation factor [Acidimicrobiales bacterium]|nr:GreA/GreB family elongation factor [Acidimicrobiales bacterium]
MAVLTGALSAGADPSLVAAVWDAEQLGPLDRAAALRLLAQQGLSERARKELNSRLERPLDDSSVVGALAQATRDDALWARVILDWGHGALDDVTARELSQVEPPTLVRPANDIPLQLWGMWRSTLGAADQHALSTLLKAFLDLNPSALASAGADRLLHRVLGEFFSRAQEVNASWTKSPLKTKAATWLQEARKQMPHFQSGDAKKAYADWQKYLKTGPATAVRSGRTAADLLNPAAAEEAQLRDLPDAERSAELKAKWADGWEPSCAIVSVTGRAALERSLAELQARLDAVREEKKSSHELSGDGWHDNPGLNQLRQVEERIMKDIAAREREIKEALVFDPFPRATDRVSLGSIARYAEFDTHDNEHQNHECEIVGLGEEDASMQRISYRSPLALALRGRRIGETLEGPSGRRLRIFGLETT